MKKIAKIKKFIFFIWKIIKQYLANSNIHGFRYLVEPERHWTEILFWAIACGLSWWACTVMVIDTIEFATSRDVSITLGTNYLKYEADVPALHICVDSNDRAKPFLKKTKISRALFKSLDLGLSERRVPTEEELQEYLRLIQPTCEDLFGICTWNDEVINCCDLFFPLPFPNGICLSFNSLQSENPGNIEGIKFIMNHRQAQGRLKIIVNNTLYFKSGNLPQAYLTSRLEYPTNMINHEKRLTLKPDKKLIIVDVTAVPTMNQPEVIDMPMTMRKCRLSSENHDNLIMKLYNYEGCLMETQMRNMYNMFGCITHVFPRVSTMRMCNVTELRAAKKSIEKIKYIDESSCLSDCEETIYDLNINNYESDNLPEWALLQIEVNMLPGPGIQYERFATRTLLEVIISVGSVIGLFMGASLLSLVELIYWLVLRTKS